MRLRPDSGRQTRGVTTLSSAGHRVFANVGFLLLGNEREQAVDGFAGGLLVQIGLHLLHQGQLLVATGQLGVVARGPHLVEAFLLDGRAGCHQLRRGGALYRVVMTW